MSLLSTFQPQKIREAQTNGEVIKSAFSINPPQSGGRTIKEKVAREKKKWKHSEVSPRVCPEKVDTFPNRTEVKSFKCTTSIRKTVRRAFPLFTFITVSVVRPFAELTDSWMSSFE